MKKICWILIWMFLLTGCAKQEQAQPLSPDEPIDIDGKRIVYFRGDSDIPISFTNDGAQKIENGTYWHYELDLMEKNEFDGPFYFYEKDSLNLCAKEENPAVGAKNCFVTNGEWALFLEPEHHRYTPKEQGDVDSAIIDAATKHLAANNIRDQKANVTDVWNCDFDGDGKCEQLFKAEEWKENGENYCFLGYLAGENCQILSGCCYPEYKEREPMDLYPMVCDLSGKKQWQILVYKRCEYESFSVFQSESGNFSKNYEIIY